MITEDRTVVIPRKNGEDYDWARVRGNGDWDAGSVCIMHTRTSRQAQHIPLLLEWIHWEKLMLTLSVTHVQDPGQHTHIWQRCDSEREIVTLGLWGFLITMTEPWLQPYPANLIFVLEVAPCLQIQELVSESGRCGSMT